MYQQSTDRFLKEVRRLEGQGIEGLYAELLLLLSNLEFGEAAVDLPQFDEDIGEDRIVLLAHRDQFLEGIDIGADLQIGIEGTLELLESRYEFLCVFPVVPEIGRGHLLLDLRHPGLQCLEVKDTP